MNLKWKIGDTTITRITEIVYPDFPDLLPAATFSGHRSDKLATCIYSSRHSRSVHRREPRVRAASHSGGCVNRAARVSGGVSWL